MVYQRQWSQWSLYIGFSSQKFEERYISQPAMLTIQRKVPRTVCTYKHYSLYSMVHECCTSSIQQSWKLTLLMSSEVFCFYVTQTWATKTYWIYGLQYCKFEIHGLKIMIISVEEYKWRTALYIWSLFSRLTVIARYI